MAKNPDKRASQADLAEFGDHELAGAPSIAALIAAFPTEEQREAYRNERRAVLADICARQGRPLCTWREYLSGQNMTVDEFESMFRDRRFALSYRRAMGETLTSAEQADLDRIDSLMSRVLPSSAPTPQDVIAAAADLEALLTRSAPKETA